MIERAASRLPLFGLALFASGGKSCVSLCICWQIVFFFFSLFILMCATFRLYLLQQTLAIVPSFRLLFVLGDSGFWFHFLCMIRLSATIRRVFFFLHFVSVWVAFGLNKQLSITFPWFYVLSFDFVWIFFRFAMRKISFTRHLFDLKSWFVFRIFFYQLLHCCFFSNSMISNSVAPSRFHLVLTSSFVPFSWDFNWSMNEINTWALSKH